MPSAKKLQPPPASPAREGEAPKNFHLDKRAATIACAIASDGQDDDLLSPREVAAWFGVTTAWLEAGRAKNFGPPFQRLSQQVVRYRRSSVLAWLKAREFTCTAQYVERRQKVEA